MIFIDPRRDDYWRRVRWQLGDWAVQSHSVLDLCCGFGKFAPVFAPAQYVGVDFSAEMVALAAAEQPLYSFLQADVRTFIPAAPVDVIFEINSLHSMGMTPEQFRDKFQPYAKVAVATLECDEFRIYQHYPKR